MHPEPTRKSRFFRPRDVIISSIILLLILAFWIWLPNIAGFALRHDICSEWSISMLLLYGDRGVRQFIKSGTHEGAAFCLMGPIFRACEENESLRREMLEHSRENNFMHQSGWSLLHFAAMYGCVNIAQDLLTEGVDLDAKWQPFGDTPLHVAADASQKELAGLLLERGADVNARDMWGRTPLNLAVHYQDDHIIALLRRHGAETGKELEEEAKAAGVQDE